MSKSRGEMGQKLPIEGHTSIFSFSKRIIYFHADKKTSSTDPPERDFQNGIFQYQNWGNPNLQWMVLL